MHTGQPAPITVVVNNTSPTVTLTRSLDDSGSAEELDISFGVTVESLSEYTNGGDQLSFLLFNQAIFSYSYLPGTDSMPNEVWTFVALLTNQANMTVTVSISFVYPPPPIELEHSLIISISRRLMTPLGRCTTSTIGQTSISPSTR